MPKLPRRGNALAPVLIALPPVEGAWSSGGMRLLLSLFVGMGTLAMAKMAWTRTRSGLIVAAVLTTAPDVLLLDEPTTGLDPVSARRLKDLLRDEVARGTTVMFSTHVLEAAEQICDRVGVLAAGRLRAEGTVAELRDQYDAASLEDGFLRLNDDA